MGQASRGPASHRLCLRGGEHSASFIGEPHTCCMQLASCVGCMMAGTRTRIAYASHLSRAEMQSRCGSASKGRSPGSATHPEAAVDQPLVKVVHQQHRVPPQVLDVKGAARRARGQGAVVCAQAEGLPLHLSGLPNTAQAARVLGSRCTIMSQASWATRQAHHLPCHSCRVC